MANLFTIKEVFVHTDSAGDFYLTDMSPNGFNIIPTPYVYSDAGEFVRIQYMENQGGSNIGTSVNQIFESLLDAGTSFDAIHQSMSSRLFGLQKLKALDDSGDSVLDSKVRLLCVIWH